MAGKSVGLLARPTGALAVRCANCWPAGSLALTPSARSLRRLLRRMYGSPRVCKGRGSAKAEVVAGMYPASSLGAFERPGPDGNPHTHTSHRLAVSSTLRRNRFRTCRSNLSTITSSVPRATLGSCLRGRVGRGRKLAFGPRPTSASATVACHPKGRSAAEKPRSGLTRDRRRGSRRVRSCGLPPRRRPAPSAPASGDAD